MLPISAPHSSNSPPFIEREKALSLIKEVAKKALRAMQIGALITLKAIALPIEVTILAVAVTLAAVSILFALPYHQHVAASVDNLWEIIKITYRAGFYPAAESLQYADNLSGSPQFALVSHGSTNSQPILYAPGYLDSPFSLRDDARELAKRTGCRVYIVQYRSPFQSIEEHAKDVARVYDRIMYDTGVNPILLGHSMGGLTTGRFIQNSTAAIKLWITLGSPLKGTSLAHLGFGACARDMQPGSAFMQKFNEPSRLNQTPSLHIYSHTDSVVPPHSAQGEHSSYKCLGHYSHIGLRSKEDVFSQIEQAVRVICS